MRTKKRADLREKPSGDALGASEGEIKGQGLRVLCVDESEKSVEAFRELRAHFDVVVEQSSVEALAALERADDFAVLVAGTDAVRVAATSKFLEAVRVVSPMTARVVLGDVSAQRDVSLLNDSAFALLSASDPAIALRTTIEQAMDYHRLLATSPAQPVEESRADHSAMLPPARLQPNQANAARLLPAYAGFSESTRDLAGEGVQIVEQAPARPRLILDSTRRVGVQILGRTIELLRGETILGRSRSCHIPISDPHISRKHACFSNDGHALWVRNLSLATSVSVNGNALAAGATRAIQVGDRLLLGGHEIELCELGDYCPSFEPTEQMAIARSRESARPASTLLTLTRVAEKYFALGQSKEAARILRPALSGLLRYSEAGKVPAAADVELAAVVTLRIAESSHAGEWIDYLFDLFSALGKPMSQKVVERLYLIIPEAQGVKMGGFRHYAETLLAHQERFGPAERFLMRRIQGLETRIMMSAHV